MAASLRPAARIDWVGSFGSCQSTPVLRSQTQTLICQPPNECHDDKRRFRSKGEALLTAPTYKSKIMMIREAALGLPTIYRGLVKVEEHGLIGYRSCAFIQNHLRPPASRVAARIQAGQRFRSSSRPRSSLLSIPRRPRRRALTIPESLFLRAEGMLNRKRCRRLARRRRLAMSYLNKLLWPKETFRRCRATSLVDPEPAIRR
jgi:hypothetical protein